VRKQLFWLVPLSVVVLGGLIALASFLPFLDPPQCPPHLTAMPDGADCIIGANIGRGLVMLLGLAVAVAGGLALVVSLLAALVKRLRRKDPHR